MLGNRNIELLIELLFPIKCVFCGQILSSSVKDKDFICNACIEEVRFSEQSVIPVCENSYCDGLISLFQYRGLAEKAIKSFKFKNKPELFRAFGHLLADRIVKVTNGEGFDIILYVPLHRIKQLARGYNQSMLLAVVVSRCLKVPLAKNVLVKERDTLPQSTLNRAVRFANVEGAFTLKRADKIMGKRVLLLDDVLTTGATLNQCGKLLRAASAEKIMCAVLATNRRGIRE